MVTLRTKKTIVPIVTLLPVNSSPENTKYVIIKNMAKNSKLITPKVNIELSILIVCIKPIVSIEKR